MINLTSLLEQKKNQIFSKNINKAKQGPTFEGKRTDYLAVLELTQSNGTLIKPKERVILEALNRLSEDGSSENIKRMLDIARNLNYGYVKGSKIDEFLNKDSSISDKTQKLNVDWQEEIKNAITKALSKNNSPEKQALTDELANVFDPKQATTNNIPTGSIWLTQKTTISQQQELIDIRNKILNSKEYNTYKNQLHDEITKKVAEKQEKIEKINDKLNLLNDPAKIKAEKEKIENLQKSIDAENQKLVKTNKNLDYFIASSEVSLPEKKEVLNLLSFLMTDEYKINPQLTDKKGQILSEMLSDLVVKTPESDVLTIKDVSQGHFGWCAAISRSRKAMAHEHKLMFVSTILSELDAKPTMEVYDATSPTGEKITVQKADIDYKTAMEEKCRIVDSGSPNWMNIADLNGNGVRSFAKYYERDEKNYGLFRDKHLVYNVPDALKPKMNYLNSILITKGLVDSLEEYKVYDAHAKEVTVEFDQAKTQTSRKLAELLDSLDPQDSVTKKQKLTAEQHVTIIKELMNPKKMSDKEFTIINPLEGKQIQQDKLLKYINTYLPGTTADKASALINEAIGWNAKDFSFAKELKVQQSLNGRYKHANELFKLAAFTRVMKEYELDIPEKLQKHAKELNVPANKEAVLKELERQNVIFSREKLDSINAEIKSISKMEEDSKDNVDVKVNASKKNFIDKYKQTFAPVENNVTNLKRSLVREKKALNHDPEFAPVLEKVFREIGDGSGNYIEREKHHSGMVSVQEARVAKQISGVDHYLETDVNTVLDHVEAGKGSTITGTMVEDFSISGHAQYVYDVKKGMALNPETGKLEEQRILYHDNTWGKIEGRDSYTDNYGTERTDYGSRRGGPNRYICDPTNTTGTTESELIHGKGIHEADKMQYSWANKAGKNFGYRYPLFMDSVISGNIPQRDLKSQRFFELLNGVNNSYDSKRVDMFFTKLLAGNDGEIYNLSNDVVVAINNKVNSEWSNIQQLLDNNELNSTITTIVSKAPDEIFTTGGKVKLNTTLPKMIKESIEEIVKSDKPENTKKVLVVRAIENIIREQIKDNTMLGKAINSKELRDINKEFDHNKFNKDFEYLINTIKGEKTSNHKDKSFPNGIDSKQTYDSLPDDNKIKMILNRIVLKDQASSEDTYQFIDGALTPDKLQEARETILSERKDLFRNCFMKSEKSVNEVLNSFVTEFGKTLDEVFEGNKNINPEEVLSGVKQVTEGAMSQFSGSRKDLFESLQFIIDQVIVQVDKATQGKYPQITENLSKKLNESFKTLKSSYDIKSLEELGDSTLSEAIINWVDTKFNPATNEELLAKVNELQDMDIKTFEGLLKSSTEPELGIKYQDPYYIVQRVRAEDGSSDSKIRDELMIYTQKEKSKDVSYYQAVENAEETCAKWLKSADAQNMSEEERKEIVTRTMDEVVYRNSTAASFMNMFKTLFSYNTNDEDYNSIKDRYVDQYGARFAIHTTRMLKPEIIQQAANDNLNILEQLGNELKDVKNELNKPSTDIKKVKELEEKETDLKETIKNNIKLIALEAIRPKYRSDVVRELNQFVKLVVNDESAPKSIKNPEQYIEKLKQNFVNTMTKQHISNFPVELLNEIAVQLPRMSKPKDETEAAINNQVISYWKDLLTVGVKETRRNMVYSKIKDETSEAEMAQIAKTIKSPGFKALTNPQTGEPITLDSKEGLMYVFSLLADPTNDDYVLKYFLEQTGLTQAAVKNILTGPGPDALVADIKPLADKYKQSNKGFLVLKGILEDAAKKQGNTKMNMDQMEMYMLKCCSQIDTALKNLGIEDKSVLEAYENNINSKIDFAKQLNTKLPDNNALNLLNKWNNDFFGYDNYNKAPIIEKIEVGIMRFNNLDKTLNMLKELLPEKYDLRDAVNEYQNTLADAVKELNKIKTDIGPMDKADTAKKTPSTDEELANSAMEGLLIAAKTKNQILFNNGVERAIQTQSTILDQRLAEILKNPDSEMYIRVAASKVLFNKGHVQEFQELAQKLVDSNGHYDKNFNFIEIIAFTVAALMNNSYSEDKSSAQTSSKLLSNLFKSVCNDQDGSQLMNGLLDHFKNALLRKGPAIDEMLLDIVTDKDANYNAKYIALDLLGQSNSVAAVPLFEDLVNNPGQVVSDKGGQLAISDVALIGLNNMIQQFPNLDYASIQKAIVALDKSIDSGKLMNEVMAQGIYTKDEVANMISSVKENIAFLRITYLEQQKKSSLNKL